MQIGGLKPSNNVFLAPMAGVADLPMRELAVKLGSGLAVGEMQTADLSLARTRKTVKRQQHSTQAGLRSVQIVGYDSDQLSEAARFNADLGADIIDINMGCPAKKVCKRAAGSALLADEVLVGQILDAVVTAVDVPITLKIRTGTNQAQRNGVRIARIAESAGIKLLAVHGRTRADLFKGEAEYETIARIVEAVSIPVLANGDINSAGKARAVLQQTGAQGVMVGRAAQGQLWLPGAIAAALKNGAATHTTPSIDQQIAIHAQHLAALHDFYGEHLGHRIARKHHAWFLDSLAEQGQITEANKRQYRQRFNALTVPQRQLAALDELADHLALNSNRPAHLEACDAQPRVGVRLAA